MYVCICKAITDQDIRQAVANGVDDLASIQTHLGAATNCGACMDHAQEVIDEALAQRLAHAI
jgi:bacterioferritin-associated ferredoxin